jgi:serine protease AprX
MLRIALLLLLLSTATLLTAQTQQLPDVRMYWVELSHKSDTLNPEASYVSERALLRRARHGVSLDSLDLPLCAELLQQVRETGAQIRHQSRWFNALVVVADNSSHAALQALEGVKNLRYIGPVWESEPEQPVVVNERLKPARQSRKEGSYYGMGARQIEMLNGQALHEKGHQGRGIWVAVFDGGFTRVDQLEVFDSLLQRGQLLGTRDFVDGNDYVFQSSGHGTQVLSTMAALQPGLLVGTAPEASYFLFKTEDTRSEYIQEEFFWIAALEYADSLGVDIVNSSLGYTLYDDSKMSYVLEDLTGQVSISSRAADIAFQKGMLVVNAAGNEGGGPWGKVSIPADSRHVLSVGAVDPAGQLAIFSSVGPTADGRLKPELVALGARTAVVSPYSGNVTGSNGTSFASPIMAGMLASLWGAYPEKTNTEILQAVFQSASQYEKPNNLKGYGIPNFQKALELLGEVE